MSWDILPDYSHEVLGVFSRKAIVNPKGLRLVDLEKKGSTSIPALDLVFDRFTIFLEEVSEPPVEMLSDLASILQWPKFRVSEIEDRLYEYYAENRSRYLDECRENDFDVEEIARRLPEVKGPNEALKLIEGPRYINGGTWEHPSLAFDCVFDIEHELHISFSKNTIHEIWNE